MTDPAQPGDPHREQPLRLGHLTTADVSLSLLLATELREASAAGYEVFAISAPGPYAKDLPEGITHVAVQALTRSWDLRRDLAAARELAGVFRRLRLDVLHTHNPKTGVLGRFLGRAARIPVVVNTCHGLWVRPEDGVGRKAFVYGSEALASLASDAELYQNDADRSTISPVVSSRRAWTVGNGIDLERFRHRPEAGRRFRAENDIAPDAVLVGGVGRRVAEKGIAELDHAARRLHNHAEVIWVGPEDDSRGDQIAGELGGVHFLAEQRDMVGVYSALDVFVLPSHREGLSRSAMEAAACGCALVLSDIRGCREIGTDGEHLQLVPPHRPDLLADAIDRLVADPHLRNRLGSAAAARAARAFDQRAIAAMSLDTYRRVALRKGLRWANRAPRSSWRPGPVPLRPADVG